MATEEILNSDFSPEEKDAILKEKIQKCGEYKKKLSSLNERYGLEVVHEKKWN